jgi:hypothetical protein
MSSTLKIFLLSHQEIVTKDITQQQPPSAPLEQELLLQQTSDQPLPRQQLQDSTSSLPDGTAEEALQQARPLLLHLHKSLQTRTQQPRRMRVVRPQGYSWTSKLGNLVWIRLQELSSLPSSPLLLRQHVQPTEATQPSVNEAQPQAETATALLQQQDAVMEEGETLLPSPSPEHLEEQLRLLREQELEQLEAERERAYMAYKQQQQQEERTTAELWASLEPSLQPSEEPPSHPPQATPTDTILPQSPPQLPSQPQAAVPNAWQQTLPLRVLGGPPPPLLILTPVGRIPLYIS